MASNQGSFRLFRVAGIDVFLHWSWFLVAVFEITQRSQRYTSLLWNVLEYVALFGIVLLHEFGHVLACRQVGGRADRILLWPLGGVAVVDPPQRPGATLWSIAAGPLVNVVLMPILLGAAILMKSMGVAEAEPNAYAFVVTLTYINGALLVFNLMPVYPLDGGQILRSLLWYALGRARSLMVATVVGFVGVALLAVLAVTARSVWFGILAVFILLSCWQGLRHALALGRVAKAPRREGFACPGCGAAPNIGEYWLCSHCGNPFDTFNTRAICPHCGTGFPETRCIDCGSHHPMREWTVPKPAPVEPPQE